MSTQLLLWALPRDLSLRAFEGCRLLQEREGPGTGWQWDLWMRLTSQWLHPCFFLSRHPRKGRRDAQRLTHPKGRIGRCVERDVKNPGEARRADRGGRGRPGTRSNVNRLCRSKVEHFPLSPCLSPSLFQLLSRQNL